MYQLLLDNKDGFVWDITELTTKMTLSTYRQGKPSTLSVSFKKNALYQSTAFKYRNGDIVRLGYQNQTLFFGYVFKIDEGSNVEVDILCYDQIRYLLNKDSYAKSNVTATQVIKEIANEYGLRLGTIAETGYNIPSIVESGQTLLDIIQKALSLTLINTGQMYTLYDNAGELNLVNIQNVMYPFYLGDNALVYDYLLQSSIDSDTFNRIVLYKDNKETGARELYPIESANGIARWGILQKYDSVDEKLNEAQINVMLQQLIKLKNRETKNFKINLVGDREGKVISIRAGGYIPIVIKDYNINQPFLIEQCTHEITGQEHKTTLDLKVV